jgi:predicted kinase
MSTINILVGISGSGKSTIASKLQKETNGIIVSRDAIRSALFGLKDEDHTDYYTAADLKEKENLVSKFFDEQIWYAIRNGKNIIADNTHLRASYIYAYKIFGVPLAVTVIDEDIYTCIRRDNLRSRQVGVDIIKKQYTNLKNLLRSDFLADIDAFNTELNKITEIATKKEYDPSKPNAIIFDIDGTLAHKGDRDIYDFTKVELDSVNHSIAYLNHAIAWHDGDHYTTTIVCSGREEICREETLRWLVKHKINFSELYMRAKGDKRKDWIIKAEFWAKIQETHNILLLVDDRDQVVHIARRFGYVVSQVNYGDF